MVKKSLPFILALFFNLYTSLAQTAKNSIEFTINRSLSYFTPDQQKQDRTGSIKLLGNIWGGEFAYKFNMENNRSDYIRVFHITTIDVAASYRNMNSIIFAGEPDTKDLLGSAYSVIGKLNINFARIGPLKFLLVPGFGLTYATQIFFTDGNTLTGSHINFTSTAGLKVLTPITNSLSIEAGINVFHYSNGGFRIPNNGISSYNTSLGIVQKLNHEAPATTHQKTDDKGSVELGMDLGMRGIYQKKDGLYKSGMFANYNYRLSPVVGLKAQFDAVYYFTTFDSTRFRPTDQYFGNSYDRWRYGISGGMDIWLGKLAVTANYGYYLHYANNYHIKTYWMPGFKYYLRPWLGLQIKTYINENSADFTGLGFTYRLNH